MAASKPRYTLGSPQEHIEMCKNHGLPFDVICEDCDEYICGECAKTEHRHHNWSTIPTAAMLRRRDLITFLNKIKEEDLPGIDEEIEKTSKQITKNERLCDTEIKKLQGHYDEIVTRLSEIRRKNEQKLRENLRKSNEKLDVANSELSKKRKEIAEIVKYMEKKTNTMSDYGFIDNHRELTKLLSALEVDMKNSTPSVRYTKGKVSDAILENLTETSSIKYGEKPVTLMMALCEDQCYKQHSDSDYIEQINKEGEEKQVYKRTYSPIDMCETDTGEIYFTHGKSIKKSMRCLSPSGSVSTVIKTDPLIPVGIYQSVDSRLLVTLRDDKSDEYKLESHSRRLVRHITVTGDVIHEYEYQEDGHTRLFTLPFRVTQNSNRDICVVNRTSPTAGEVLIMSTSGRMKSVYRGQNLTEDFMPGNVVCDSLCNILVPDINDKKIHLLGPDGEFLKFLLTENEVIHPTRLSLCKSTLWVGYWEGRVKVFQYECKI